MAPLLHANCNKLTPVTWGCKPKAPLGLSPLVKIPRQSLLMPWILGFIPQTLALNLSLRPCVHGVQYISLIKM